LGVELLQRVHELLVVLDPQRQLEVVVELDVGALDDVVAPAEPARPGGDIDDASVGAGQPVGVLSVPPEEDRHRDRVADLLGLWSSRAPWTTRFTFSAASSSSSGTCPSPPETSSAFTSICDASTGPSSSRLPVRMLTTPPGTSAVASTSASSTAASGCCSEATTTTELPPTIAGATRETSPSSAGSGGARIPTTPVGSGTVKLK